MGIVKLVSNVSTAKQHDRRSLTPETWKDFPNLGSLKNNPGEPKGRLDTV